MRRRKSAHAGAALAALALASCASRGAPSFVAFGAYFPGWMLCGMAGVLTAIGTRIALILTGLTESVPFQLGICLSAGIIVAIVTWLAWFGR